MSNTLYIAVTQFKSLPHGETTFGYTAADAYGRDYSDAWESLEAFYAEFPNADALQELVLSTPPFDDFVIGESGRISIQFDGQ